ncbi:long-chain-alcohol oxidase FAO4A [Vitis riparia]|uniref:long-chain-alcohol oxidase FAO4A n=1 Tax=Vitis riparia TaxID=96939 RepID=UPI00155AB59A|nr:long-chain-alcohol oxidase FAO4A [Vitis riparia]
MENREQEHTLIELGVVEARQELLNGGGRQLYLNKLSSREMESLIAISDTFLPSVEAPHNAAHAYVDKFYRTSASMAGTPHIVGGLISERLEHPKLWMVRVVLWLLSTWFGTFIICGLASMSSHFPYFQSFPQVSPHKRHEIVLSWSLSYFSLIRMLFRSLKLVTLLVFFTQVDEKNENLTWKAIGYCGPDPDFKTLYRANKTAQANGYGRSIYEREQEEEDDREDFIGPLYRGLINIKRPREVVAEALRLSGFSISIHSRKHETPNSSSPLIIRCDAVVIGSGSGGGVAAGVLAKAGYKVLVLEKGNYCARSNLSLLEGPTLDQMYLYGGMLATDDTGVIILAGSTVGGGSTINWSASIRTPQHVRKEWCDQHELELFDSQVYKEAMDVVCEKMGVQSEIYEEGLNNAVLRRGCQELGYPVTDIPRNAQPKHYCGWCCFGCKDGRKKGTAETWLVDMMNSGNGVILPGCEAIKVLHNRKKGRARSTATGVAFEFEYKGVKEVFMVESKVTIVACGALSTPGLLKRSGLKNPNIGKNLHLHPVAMAWGHFPEPTPLSPSPGCPGLEKRSYEGEIMTVMSTVVADIEGSGYGAVIQTPSLHPGMFSVVMPWISGPDMKDRMIRYSRTAHIFALARDKGSGTISSPSTISYQMDETDEENLKRGMEKLLRILAAAGAEEIGTHNCNGRSINVKKVSSHAFERFVKEESSRALRDLSTPVCSAHQMGSCRMGVDPRSSAVNQMGETWEVEGLYVADTSVFPTALGVNPMVTVQAIAYSTAKSVVEVLRRKKKETCAS